MDRVFDKVLFVLVLTALVFAGYVSNVKALDAHTGEQLKLNGYKPETRSLSYLKSKSLVHLTDIGDVSVDLQQRSTALGHEVEASYKLDSGLKLTGSYNEKLGMGLGVRYQSQNPKYEHVRFRMDILSNTKRGHSGILMGFEGRF